MGLKDFLKNQGFIQDSPKESSNKDDNKTTAVSTPVAPTFFPMDNDAATEKNNEPSFVTPLPEKSDTNFNISTTNNKPDEAFIKYFEEELDKVNLVGNDYLEFRKLLLNTQAKMANKGSVNPELVLQIVMSSFEAQGLTKAKLVETAQFYKDALNKKTDEFIVGARSEKNNQLQKRQDKLQAHEQKINYLQQQIQDLTIKKKQMEDEMNKERTQLDVDKTMGQEGIIKIERAEKMIQIARDYMVNTIDNDIQKIQTL